jgi:hypothetical protein
MKHYWDERELLRARFKFQGSSYRPFSAASQKKSEINRSALMLNWLLLSLRTKRSLDDIVQFQGKRSH